MQFLYKLFIPFVILFFKLKNVNVPYFIAKPFIIHTNGIDCKESINGSSNIKVNKNSENISQESRTNTHNGDSKLFKKEITDSNSNSHFKNFPKRGITLDQNIDLGFPKNTDPYGSLCFVEDLKPGEPLQLVYPNREHTKLLINQEVLRILENIPKPIYPVGIIGSVNTGKSLLLNLLNDNHLCNSRVKQKGTNYGSKEGDNSVYGSENNSVKSDTDHPSYSSSYRESKLYREHKESKEGKTHKDSKGFKVANTPEPETFGIWLYSEPLKITRRCLEEKLRRSEEGSKANYYSLKNISDKEGSQSPKLSRVSSAGLVKGDEDPDEEVNVVFIDIEGFSSHKNVFKYDEAVFSIASSICSEVIYLSNKTLNSSDLQLVEELIKSSLLSKISNLYTLYTNVREFREDREEIFQYFLKMYENKNLTFLINEFNYTSERGFENLVNLLRGPKRDLSLHELYMYHNSKKDEEKDNKNRLLEQEEMVEEGMGSGSSGSGSSGEKTDNGTGKKVEGKIESSQRKTRNTNNNEQKEDTVQIEEDKTKPTPKSSGTGKAVNFNGGGSGSLDMGDVMFNNNGYIFHMLFNTVNTATLPSTSKNSLFMSVRDGLKENKNKKIKGKLNGDEEYIANLSKFKLELFQRSTISPLVKYCVVDGVTRTCRMSGRDLAEMVRFTINTLSLNKFYKLATNLGSIEGMGKIEYKDAFDEYFRMFRSTRLLMIKNDLYETYKNILKGYIQSSEAKSKDQKGYNEGGQMVEMSIMPTITMLRNYSQKLKNQLLELLVKNYENEALTDDFNEIKADLLQGFDKVSELAEDELYSKLKNYCTEVAEKLIEAYQENIDRLEFPVLPSKLKFLHDLPSNFRKQYGIIVNGMDPEDEENDYMVWNTSHGSRSNGDSTNSSCAGSNTQNTNCNSSSNNSDGTSNYNGNNYSGTDDSNNHYSSYTHHHHHHTHSFRKELLSEDHPCDMVSEQYLVTLEQKIGEVIKKNEDLIDKHFMQIMTRALNHFRIKFIEVERNYEMALEEALKLTNGVVKEAHNIMVTHLGEFHAMEYLVNEYKVRLRQSLQEEVDFFKKLYTRRCLEKFKNMESHYLDKYRMYLEQYTGLPANPEMLVKYHEYIRYLSRSEFYKAPCIGYVEIEKKHRRFEGKLKNKFKELMRENVDLVSSQLEEDFDKMDEYLMSRVAACKLYSYFRYNARRYAKFKITQKLIFTRLNLQEDPQSPEEVLLVEGVLFNPENARPTSATNFNMGTLGAQNTIAASYDIDLNELNRKFIRLNTGSIQQAFLNRVVERYMDDRMPNFKKMFMKRYCNFMVLICSIILLGLSVLSFTLAENGYSKLGFSILGFVSYAFLVGLESTKKTLRRLEDLLKNVLKRCLNEVLKVSMLMFNKVMLLVGVAATFVFMKMGFLYTFLFGFMSAILLFIYYKVRRFIVRRNNKNK